MASYLKILSPVNTTAKQTQGAHFSHSFVDVIRWRSNECLNAKILNGLTSTAGGISRMGGSHRHLWST